MKRLVALFRRKADETGQALVEAAFFFIILAMLVGGLVEFGWAYFHYLALQSAAGEGAAYGMMFSTWHDSSDEPDPNNVVYRVQHESQSGLIDWSNTNVLVEAPFVTAGNPITVTVTYTHTLLTPLLTPLVPDGTIVLEARAVQRILSAPPP